MGRNSGEGQRESCIDVVAESATNLPLPFGASRYSAKPQAAEMGP